MRALCLVGMSGIGKSHWSERLVREAGCTRHDCDGDIAARLSTIVPVASGESPVNALGVWMGMPWSDGYAAREARYLALEEDVTRAALEAVRAGAGPQVLDTTGSVIYLSPPLLAAIRETCRVVYLRTPERWREAMLERYRTDPKPVVWSGAFTADDAAAPAASLPARFAELLRLRDARYAALADTVLDGAGLEANDPGVAGFLAACGS